MTNDLQDKNLRMRIKHLSSTFSKKEKMIAEYIVEHPENIIYGTINQVASELGLADSTVFRFCKRLGYNGFQNLKIAIASEQSSNLSEIHEKVKKSDDEKTILEKVFRSNMQTLSETLEVIDEDRFSMAVNKILKSNKVEFFGSGGSNVVAMDGYHKFIRTGLQVSHQIDSHFQMMSASQLKKGDVGILISHTGHSKDILEIVETLKKQQVFTIGITGFAGSPLNQEVDISLNTLAEETDFRSEALTSRIAQLSILDALYVNIMMKIGEKRKESLNGIREAIEKKRV